MDEPEEWRPVPFPDYADLYEVSNHGRVRRVKASFHSTQRIERVLSPGRGIYGHAHLTLHKGPDKKCIGVHVLVALAFIGPKPSPTHQCAHDDGDPANNRVSNLKWATPKENSEDARRHGTVRTGESLHNAVLTEAKIRRIRRLHAAGVKQSVIARTLETSDAAISQILRGKRWSSV